MQKTSLNFTVVSNRHISPLYSLLILHAPCHGADHAGNHSTEETPFTLAGIKPGQFVQVRIDGSNSVFLRRPISVCFVNAAKDELWLLVRRAGEGTSVLCDISPGSNLNLILSLGNGFTLPGPDKADGFRPLLVGGGVGVAPLLYLGYCLREIGAHPEFLLAARSEADLLLLDKFREIGPVHISTDDGSAGTPGLVTANEALLRQWSMIYCCGPQPMMKAVGKLASSTSTPCEVSLENTMACGLGACLCCVEDTIDAGNVCVCTEGPVFPTTRLKGYC